jgi:endonuclease/exonuclease/phosphatase family metal-dependent hydrolase
LAAVAAASTLPAPATEDGRCVDAAPWVFDESAAPEADALASPRTLDVVTYNLHSGLGDRHALLRRRASVERNLRAIAASIAGAAADGAAPDVVGLNEVDFGSRRSAWIDQARFVADELERMTGRTYAIVRGETWRRDVPGLEVRFGNAALVRAPVLEARTCLFDDLAACGLAPAAAATPRRGAGVLGRLFGEPRGVIRVTLDVDGQPFDVLVTHLEAVDAAVRESQAERLLGSLAPARSTVVLGDMNAVPGALTRNRRWFSRDRTHAILATGTLADASLVFASRQGQRSLAAWATYPAAAPAWGLDWVLASLDLSPQAVAAVGDAASDHRGLYVRYRRLGEGAELAAARTRHGRICERLRAYDADCRRRG